MGFHISKSEVLIPYTLSIEIFLLLNEQQRQPKRTMCGFGLQSLFGRNILELLVYYLMPNNAKILKIWSLLVCLSALVAFNIMKVDISCIITFDSSPSCSNFITCATLTTVPCESDVLSIWRGRQTPTFKSHRIIVRLRIMAKRGWPESIWNAALLWLMQLNLETGTCRAGRLYALWSGWWQF